MKTNKTAFAIIAILLVTMVFLSGCQVGRGQATPTPIEIFDGEEDQFIGIPNPASFYCQEMGYELDLRETDGGTEGICVFPNGSECEEWEFLAGGCFIEWTFCQRQGYNISTSDDGAICTFKDGSSCSEYEFFIGECQAPE